MMTQVRVIVYESRDGSENLFEMMTVEDEQHERAQAERELHSRDTDVVGYHFAWLEKEEFERRKYGPF